MNLRQLPPQDTFFIYSQRHKFPAIEMMRLSHLVHIDDILIMLFARKKTLLLYSEFNKYNKV